MAHGLLSAGIRSLLRKAEGADLSRSAEAPDLGRHHPGTVGDIISERWARSSRNRWAASSRIGGRLHPESAPANSECSLASAKRACLLHLGFWHVGTGDRLWVPQPPGQGLARLPAASLSLRTAGVLRSFAENRRPASHYSCGVCGIIPHKSRITVSSGQRAALDLSGCPKSAGQCGNPDHGRRLCRPAILISRHHASAAR